jgi:hypothetical protein
VECSPALKTLQHKNLKCVDEENEDTDKRTVSTLVGTPVSWHATLEQVPSGCMYCVSNENRLFNIKYNILLVI